jgi:hypothetical protein
MPWPIMYWKEGCEGFYIADFGLRILDFKVITKLNSRNFSPAIAGRHY